MEPIMENTNQDSGNLSPAKKLNSIDSKYTNRANGMLISPTDDKKPKFISKAPKALTQEAQSKLRKIE